VPPKVTTEAPIKAAAAADLTPKAAAAAVAAPAKAVKPTAEQQKVLGE